MRRDQMSSSQLLLHSTNSLPSPNLLSELKALRQRKNDLEQHMNTLQDNRKQLMDVSDYDRQTGCASTTRPIRLDIQIPFTRDDCLAGCVLHGNARQRLSVSSPSTRIDFFSWDDSPESKSMGPSSQYCFF